MCPDERDFADARKNHPGPWHGKAERFPFSPGAYQTNQSIHIMRTILITLFLAVASLSLGACKHRNKKCPCSAKAPVATPVATSSPAYFK